MKDALPIQVLVVWCGADGAALACHCLQLGVHVFFRSPTFSTGPFLKRYVAAIDEFLELEHCPADFLVVRNRTNAAPRHRYRRTPVFIMVVSNVPIKALRFLDCGHCVNDFAQSSRALVPTGSVARCQRKAGGMPPIGPKVFTGGRARRPSGLAKSS